MEDSVQINKYDENGDTPLIRATISGDYEEVRRLLISGADKEIGDDTWGNTPLTIAQRKSHSSATHREIAALLLLKEYKHLKNNQTSDSNFYSEVEESRSSKDEWFDDAELVLLKLIANIMQTSHKDTSRLANAVIAKASGLAGASGVIGLVSTFGSASTGTAIATLTGAASTNATMYWLGSLVGGGVFAGTILTGGIGILAGYYGLKWWKGTPRDPDDLTDEENRIINASLALIKAIREQIESNVIISKKDAKTFKEIAWEPLLKSVSDYDDSNAIDTLNFKNYILLGRRKRKIEELSDTFLDAVK
jgi:hypothetical protein